MKTQTNSECTLTMLVLVLIISSIGATDVDSGEIDSAPPENIAVLDLEPRGGLTAQEILSISDRLRGELIETGKFVVLERAQMGRILQEQGFQQTGVCSDASCMVEVGQLLAVTKMIGGSIGKVGRAFSVNLKIIDVQSGRIDRQISDDIKCSKEELVSLHIGNLARRIAGLEKKRKRLVQRWFFWAPIAVVGVGGAAFGGMLLADKFGNEQEQQYDEVDVTVPVVDFRRE